MTSPSRDATSNSAEDAPLMQACVRPRPEPADPPHRFGDCGNAPACSTNGSAGESVHAEDFTISRALNVLAPIALRRRQRSCARG